MSALLIIVSLTMTLFSEKIFISNRCISGLMSNLIKKSWTVSKNHICIKDDDALVKQYVSLVDHASSAQ